MSRLCSICNLPIHLLKPHHHCEKERIAKEAARARWQQKRDEVERSQCQQNTVRRYTDDDDNCLVGSLPTALDMATWSTTTAHALDNAKTEGPLFEGFMGGDSGGAGASDSWTPSTDISSAPDPVCDSSSDNSSSYDSSSSSSSDSCSTGDNS